MCRALKEDVVFTDAKTKDDEQKSTLNIFSEPKNDRINFPIHSHILITDGLLDFSLKEKEEEWLGVRARDRIEWKKRTRLESIKYDEDDR